MQLVEQWLRQEPPLAGREEDWNVVVRALDPEEEERTRKLYPDYPDHARSNREAILPDPVTGRELVDRELVEHTRGQPIAVPPAFVARTQRAVAGWRLPAGNFVLPVARGG